MENANENIGSQSSARNKIVDILTRVDTRQSYTDKLLDREINSYSDEDRALITEVVNGVLRWRFRLDWNLNQLYVGEYDNLIPDVKNNLRASIYQLIYLDRIPAYAILNEAVEIAKSKYNQKTANLVNAILRNFLRQQKKLEYQEMQLGYIERLCVTLSHPAWLIQRWVEQWGVDDTMALCEANNARPRIAIRINHLLLTDENALFAEMEEKGVTYERNTDFPEFIWIDDFSEFRKLDYLRNGQVAVQDVSTGIPVRLLRPQPGERVLDMCAAPGGKSAYISEFMQNQGLLVDLEKHAPRAKALKDNLERLGVTVAEVINGDGLSLPLNIKFDKILLDAPCSGFGVINKRVDLKWKRLPEDIENMHKLQLSLLDAAAAALADNGVIVYSTCTIEKRENEDTVDEFLAAHPEFVKEDLRKDVPQHYLWDRYSVRTFPHRHQTDGSFAVRLRKKGNAAS
ncbi:MAG: 16S rRNA (cytosine(967)-C(5))-methyltransferase RsmB [Calditrichia bacterium]